ncbi:MAG: hypothetical protein ABIN69_05085 [Aestuariivirga sp.]
MSINFSRGFFRGWLVVSAVWVLASIWLGVADANSRLKVIDALESGSIAKGARLLLPGEYEARTTAPLLADDKIIVGIAGTNVLFDKSLINESEEDQRETVFIIAHKFKIAMEVKPRLSRIWTTEIATTAPWAIGAPLILFLSGALARWIFLGFKAKK